MDKEGQEAYFPGAAADRQSRFAPPLFPLYYHRAKSPLPKEKSVISRETTMQRVILVRIAPGEDILLGLRQTVAQHQIKNGLILTGFGSASHSHFHVVMSNDLPPEESYPKRTQPPDICSFNGYILDGKVHCHIDFSDERNGFGGHLEEGTLALTFANIAIGEIADSPSIVGWDTIADESQL